MKVLIACEFSGTVREEFKKLGWDAWSCDLLDTEISGNHYKGDVFDIIDQGWDLMIAHPPCTYLTNSGVRWLYNPDKSHNTQRWLLMRQGAKFFKKLLDADIPYIAIENPIPHKYAINNIGRKYDQKIQPWMFGHGETKATCLWLKNLPHLEPTNIVDGREARMHKLPPSKDRWKIRSKTYQGIAEALALQYTQYLKKSNEI